MRKVFTYLTLSFLLFAVGACAKNVPSPDTPQQHRLLQKTLPREVFDLSPQTHQLIMKAIKEDRNNPLRSSSGVRENLFSLYQLPEESMLKKFRLMTGEEFYLAQFYPIQEPDYNDILFAGFVLDGNLITKQVYVRIYNPEQKTKVVEIYTPQQQLLSSYSVNLEKAVIQPVFLPSSFMRGGSSEWGEYESRSDCIMSCMDNAYRKNGWASVILICVTVCYPEATIASALYCGSWCEDYKQSLKKNGN